MIYNGKIFKPFDDTYFISEDGKVYSSYKKGTLKQYIDHDGYHRVDIHGKHTKVHRLVYIVWSGHIPDGMQVNHRDDDKSNNHVSNLYLGTQAENITDCFNNNHRVGHVHIITVHDNVTDTVITFPSIKEFLDYTEHSITNGSLSHCRNKKWFQNRFTVIEQKGVSTIESYKSIRALYEGGVEDKAEDRTKRVE